MSDYTTTHRRMIFRVEALVPADATEEDAIDFIQEWLEMGGGCRHLDDPLFGSFENVSVRRVRRQPPQRTRSP
jgi:hypothetical protein